MKPFIWVFLSVLVGGFPNASWAQSRFSGMYFGTFSGPDDNGQFGILVRVDGSAIIAAYDAVDNDGFINENVTIGSDGTFFSADIDGEGTSVSGGFTSSGVSGDLAFAGGSTASFNGSKESNSGFLREAGGFYKGTLSGQVILCIKIFVFQCNEVCQSSGEIFGLAAANGVAFAYASAICSGFGREETGGFYSIDANGVISGDLDGTSIVGNLNITSLSASGSYDALTGDNDNFTFFPFPERGTGGSHSGTWTMARELPLPKPKSMPWLELLLSDDPPPLE